MEKFVKKTFEAEDLRVHHVELMQLMNLEVLLPSLKRRNVLSKQDMERVVDTKHHGTIERAGFLLNVIYKQEKATINKFVQCLREEKKHYGHQEIMEMLERGVPELPDQNPLFEILSEALDEIVETLNFTTFLNNLVESGAINVESFLDLVNPDRPLRESLEKLLFNLEGNRTQGFIDFLSALQKDSPPSHDKLFKKLFSRVQKFFKEDERRDEISYSDRIAILQLETREKVLEMEVSQRFKVHHSQLVAKLDLNSLMPYLHKSLVLSSDELKDMAPGPAGNEALLKLIGSKTPFWLVKFAECLREDPKNQDLAQLLFPPPPAPVKLTAGAGGEHRHDKVAVFMSMKKYVKVAQDYTMDEHKSDIDKKAASERKKLQGKFESMNFRTVEFELSGSSSWKEQKQGKDKHGEEKKREESKDVSHSHEKELETNFKEKVASICAEEAIVFIYMSGIQIPHEEDGKRTGAILLSEVSTISRKEHTDCVKARDLRRWLHLIPTCHVTFLIDCEHNFIAKYGKQRTPDSVDMVEDPWAMLTDLDLTTVVYYLQPDMSALPQLTEEDVKKATGSLTETFSFALSHCFLQKKREKTVNYLSHRRFYEAMSFYWHKRGRLHKPFVPAVVGDKDREFMGRRGVPHQQVFMVNLTRQNHIFNLDELYIQIGTFAGLQERDSMEMFHVLRPGERVKGVIKESHPISCSVTLPLDEERRKLKDILSEIYKLQENTKDTLFSKDHSTEFLWALKVFPMRDRYPVTTEGLSEADNITIKTYLETMSSHVRHATRGIEPVLKVCKSGGRYYIKDVHGDIKDVHGDIKDVHGDIKEEIKVLRLELVLSFLESIAWYKHVIHLGDKSPIPPLTAYRCFLTSERPLLHVAVPLCDEFCFKWSSFEGAPRSSKGHEAILQSTESQTFWKPEPKDLNPCLEVEFFKNHIITSIELKGDYQGEKPAFVRTANVFYQSEVINMEVDNVPTKPHLNLDILIKKDSKVQFVSITPQDPRKEFTLNFKPFFRPSTSRTVDTLTISNWGFHQQNKTPWRFVPSPDPKGCIKISGQQWISWSGKSATSVIFDLGMPGFEMEKIVFANPLEANILSKFTLKLKTIWKKEELPTFPSAWPCKYEFPRPIVTSSLQLWPTNYKEHSDVKVQMQLFGNKYDSPIEVEEGELLSFHFNNYTNHGHFVYILCLEETGTIKHLMKDVADPITTREGKSIFPVMKKLIQSTIPESYSPESGSIKDTYKVFVCQRQLYLDPLFQKGLSSYHHSLSYRATSSLGHKEMRREQCFYFKFNVNVKQRSNK